MVPVIKPGPEPTNAQETYIIAIKKIKNAQPGCPVIKANNARMVPKNALSLESMLVLYRKGLIDIALTHTAGLLLHTFDFVCNICYCVSNILQFG